MLNNNPNTESTYFVPDLFKAILLGISNNQALIYLGLRQTSATPTPPPTPAQPATPLSTEKEEWCLV